MVYRYTIGLLIVLSFFPGCVMAQEHQVEDIVAAIDELYRHDTSKAKMEMNIVTPHWERTLTMNVWTEGMDKTLIRILSPQKERGVGTLRVGNEMWNYLPQTNKVIRVPPSMMMSSWMGSDFNNNDLVKEFSLLEDYRYRLITPDSAATDRLYVECIPKEDRPIVWGKVVVTVRESDSIPVREEYYDEHDKLMRVMLFREIKTFDDVRIPSVMELIPQDEKDNRTLLRYLDAQFDVPLSDEIFTLRKLRSDIE
jgi:outer membrane lipoprotein-sorting protein